jgi:hypothetical protein
MDLVSALSGQLGLSQDQARALAGTVIQGVQSQVQDEEPEAAKELGAAVPELGDWTAMAAKFLDAPAHEAKEDTGLGGMLGGLASAAGGSGLLGGALEAVAGKEARQTAQVVALLDRFGVGSDKAVLIAPLAMNFLKERLSDEVFDKALSMAPMLLGSGGDAPAADAGGIAGTLGGLFG